MAANKNSILVLLIVLNLLVLLGQIYPDGAPPFARIVNVFFLVFSLIYLVTQFNRKQ